MDFLRKYWQDIGLMVAIGVGVYLIMEWEEISNVNRLLWLSFIAILIHQFEEYRWPGYFPGLFNGIIFKSEHPERYPLNTQSAMIINLVIAYAFYLLPVFFPTIIWLGLAPIFLVFFNLSGTAFLLILKQKPYTIQACSLLYFYIYQLGDGISIR